MSAVLQLCVNHFNTYRCVTNRFIVSAAATSIFSHSRAPFASSSIASAQSQSQKRKHRDPYALAQARQRKAANLARQAGLKKERAAALGDPVKSNPTPFIGSLDQSIPPSVPPPNASNNPTEPTSSPSYLNYFVTPTDLSQSFDKSHSLTSPVTSRNRSIADPAAENEASQLHNARHATAMVAMKRIMSLENASATARKRVHIARCIEAFGRHRTDSFLAPKPLANIPRDPSLPPAPTKTPRAGPDTGSPEVQIAVLTTKIRVLARHLETIGRKDKVNKRNLQLLVHRRQKMLQYLRRKERGGERWSHAMETLGLSDGAWQGEIALR